MALRAGFSSSLAHSFCFRNGTVSSSCCEEALKRRWCTPPSHVEMLMNNGHVLRSGSNLTIQDANGVKRRERDVRKKAANKTKKKRGKADNNKESAKCALMTFSREQFSRVIRTAWTNDIRTPTRFPSDLLHASRSVAHLHAERV